MLLWLQAAANSGHSTVEIQATPATTYLADVMKRRQLIADVQQVQKETQHCLIIHIQSGQQLSKICTDLLERCHSRKETARSEPALADIFSPIIDDLQSSNTSVRLQAIEQLKDLGR